MLVLQRYALPIIAIVIWGFIFIIAQQDKVQTPKPKPVGTATNADPVKPMIDPLPAAVPIWTPSMGPTVIPHVQATEKDGKYCPNGLKSFLLRTWWKNTGNRPIRAVYISVTVYNKNGKVVCDATDYPIYSVPDTEPGILPGETRSPGPTEGFTIPFGVGHPDEPERVKSRITRATEEGINR